MTTVNSSGSSAIMPISNEPKRTAAMIKDCKRGENKSPEKIQTNAIVNICLNADGACADAVIHMRKLIDLRFFRQQRLGFKDHAVKAAHERVRILHRRSGGCRSGTDRLCIRESAA